MTTVPRTLVDLAAVVQAHDLRRVVEQAEVLRLADPLSLDAAVHRHQGRHGVARLAGYVVAGERVTRSELERRFLGLLEAHDIELPKTNASIQVGDRWIEADRAWRGARLIVELDGHAFHSTREAFERDRERDRLLQAAGWRVVRLTWRQLREDDVAAAGDVARMLA